MVTLPLGEVETTTLHSGNQVVLQLNRIVKFIFAALSIVDVEFLRDRPDNVLGEAPLTRLGVTTEAVARDE